jgi:hypothetical protein
VLIVGAFIAIAIVLLVAVGLMRANGNQEHGQSDWSGFGSGRDWGSSPNDSGWLSASADSSSSGFSADSNSSTDSGGSSSSD